MPFEILSGRHPRQAASGAGEEAEDVGDGRHFIINHAVQRLAAVQRLQLRRVSACAEMASASFRRHSARVFGVV